MSSPLPVKNDWLVGDDYTPLAANDIADAVNAMGLITRTVQAADYDAPAGSLVPCDATSGSFVVSLPTMPLDTTHVAIIKTDVSANVITISTSGSSDTFSDGSTTISLLLGGQSVFLQYAATPRIWYVISGGSAPGGGAIFGETPSGVQDGMNLTFTLDRNFQVGSTRVERNGLRERPGVGYTESSPDIIFTTAPLVTDTITVDYQIA